MITTALGIMADSAKNLDNQHSEGEKFPSFNINPIKQTSEKPSVDSADNLLTSKNKNEEICEKEAEKLHEGDIVGRTEEKQVDNKETNENLEYPGLNTSNKLPNSRNNEIETNTSVSESQIGLEEISLPKQTIGQDKTVNENHTEYDRNNECPIPISPQQSSQKNCGGTVSAPDTDFTDCNDVAGTETERVPNERTLNSQNKTDLESTVLEVRNETARIEESTDMDATAENRSMKTKEVSDVFPNTDEGNENEQGVDSCPPSSNRPDEVAKESLVLDKRPLVLGSEGLDNGQLQGEADSVDNQKLEGNVVFVEKQENAEETHIVMQVEEGVSEEIISKKKEIHSDVLEDEREESDVERTEKDNEPLIEQEGGPISSVQREDDSESSSFHSIIKLEPSPSSASKGLKEPGRSRRGACYKSDNKDQDDFSKKKKAMLSMLKIPAKQSKNMTEEELNILTKYILMNPKASASIGKPSKKGGKAKKSDERKRGSKPKDYTITSPRGTSRRKVAKRVTLEELSNPEDSEDELNDPPIRLRVLRVPLHDQLKVLDLKKKGLKNKDICEKLNLVYSMVCRILQDKKNIVAMSKLIKKKGKSEKEKKERAVQKRRVSLSESDEEFKLEAGEVDNVKGDDDDDGGGDEIDEESSKISKKKKKRPRNDLTLEDKRKVIEAMETSDVKVVDLAKRFNVSSSSISRIRKSKEIVKLRLANGDFAGNLKRLKDCKDPDIDKALTKWYRAFQAKHSTGDVVGTVSVTNYLLKEKAHDLALIMGNSYFASDNWIIRWKTRHNIKSKLNLITDRDTFLEMDAAVDVTPILKELGKQRHKIDEAMREALRQQNRKSESLTICEHCGVQMCARSKRLDHEPGCPGILGRKDLTLQEKAKVVKCLDQPGVTMVSLAKKFGVSSSAISRIHKNRVEILARVAEGGKSLVGRKRDRPSKEPEVEKLLCEWYKRQRDMGVYPTGPHIRRQARDIATALGKDFYPCESWVFRWRNRHNMKGNPSELEDSDEDDDDDDDDDKDDEMNSVEETEGTVEVNNTILDPATGLLVETQTTLVPDDASEGGANKAAKSIPKVKLKAPRKLKYIMCEKCGFVSERKRNSLPGRMRHAKGCPDIRARNERTYEDRAKMVQALELPGATLSSVAREFGVSVSSMSRIRQRKDVILSVSGDRQADKRRIRPCKEPEVAEMLYKYYLEKKAQGIHINGPKLKEQASAMAKEMGRVFKVSSGWLGRWKHRYNVLGSPTPHFNHKDKDKEIGDTPKPVRKKQQRKPKSSNSKSGDKSQPVQPDKAVKQTGHADSEDFAGTVLAEDISEHYQQPPIAHGPSSASLQPPMFVARRPYQSTYDLLTQQQQQQQQATEAAWAKDFMPGAVATSTLSDSEAVGYTSYETPAGMLAKPIFHHHHHHPAHHNMFEPFPMTYQITLPTGLDASGNMMMGRGYFKDEVDSSTLSQAGLVKPGNTSTSCGSSSNNHNSNGNNLIPSPIHQSHGLHLAAVHPTHLPHPHSSLLTPVSASHSSSASSSVYHQHHHHGQLQQLSSHHHNHNNHHNQQHHSSSSHHQHHPEQLVKHIHNNNSNLPLQSQNATQHQQAASAAALTPTPDDDNLQLMEALKVMSSFASRKSLGNQVQSALRTIEMSVKGGGNSPRKTTSRASNRNSYNV